MADLHDPQMRIPMACAICGTIRTAPDPITCEHSQAEWETHFTAHPEQERRAWLHTEEGWKKLEARLKEVPLGAELLANLPRPK
jgi:hypothetical protein